MTESTRPDWRIECRRCGAWLVTHLHEDITQWLLHHGHTGHEHSYKSRGRDDVGAWDCDCGDTMEAALARISSLANPLV